MHFLELADQADVFVTSGMVKEAIELYDEAIRRAIVGERVDPETGTDWVSFLRGKKAILQVMMGAGCTITVTERGHEVVVNCPQRKQTGN